MGDVYMLFQTPLSIPSPATFKKKGDSPDSWPPLAPITPNTAKKPMLACFYEPLYFPEWRKYLMIAT